MDSLKNENTAEAERQMDFYPLRVWLCTAFLSPVLFLCVSSITNVRFISTGIGLTVIFLLFGVAVSVPFFALYRVIFDTINKKLNRHLIRLILVLTSLTFMTLVFLGFGMFDLLDELTVFVVTPYYVVNIAATWLLKLRSEKAGN